MGDEIELLHWGILGTGCHAKCFIGNLSFHVGREDPNGPHHTLVGVASSRSRDVAKEFLESFDVLECTLTFRDYSELVRSNLIDVVFVATPRSHHFQNALLALEAGDHVVCQSERCTSQEAVRNCEAGATIPHGGMVAAVTTSK